MAEQSWIERQLGNKLLRGTDGARQASKMLQRSDTNRIVHPPQAMLLMLGRDAAAVFRADGLTDLADWLEKECGAVEDYQLTVGNPVNSRESFGNLLGAELAAEAAKPLPDGAK